MANQKSRRPEMAERCRDIIHQHVHPVCRDAGRTI
jgi:hypothetical protein